MAREEPLEPALFIDCCVPDRFALRGKSSIERARFTRLPFRLDVKFVQILELLELRVVLLVVRQ